MGMLDCHRCCCDLQYMGDDHRQEWREEYYRCGNCDQEHTRTIYYKPQSDIVDSDSLTMDDTPLTPKVIDIHIENQSDCCPYCFETDIHGLDMPVVEDNLVIQYVKCAECEKEWSNVYKLCNIYEEKR